jgi:Flp pilus assembly protein TadG
MLSNLHSALGRRFRNWRDERGNAAMVFALATPLLVGGAGLAVETSFDYVSQSRLQSAADAAAYAAAIEKMGGADYAHISAAATQQASANGWMAGPGGTGITVNNPPTAGAYTGQANAVEVRLSQTVPRFFTAVFSTTTVTAGGRGVAIGQTAANACILALNPTAAQAIQVQGNTTVTLNGCDVMSDSIAPDAVNVWGSSTLRAECAVSVGGVTNHGGMTLSGCPAAITNAPRVGDPFSGLATPSAGAPQSVPGGSGTMTISPGSYAGGMTLKGNVTMSPGVYYVTGGDFRVNAGANVTGSGVTIYTASGSNVNINGNATLNIAAPTSGAYSGILFFGARGGTGSNTFNGTASSHLTGDLYFPSQQVSYLGNFAGVNGCTQIIADTVQWSGSSTIGVNCAAEGMTNIPARQAIKMVE